MKSLYDPATAKALLDRFGYDKRDPDGFRRAPDGSRLTLTLSLRTGGVMRETQTLWKKNMEAIGLRTEFNVAPFQEIIKDLEKGKFQMYQGGFGGSPSGYNSIRSFTASSRSASTSRSSQRRLRPRRRAVPAQRHRTRSRSPPRARCTDIARTYMPQLPVYFRLESNYVQPWLQGFRPGVFSSYWKYLDIDTARRK